MFFTTKNAGDNVGRAAELENVLDQVSRAITNAELDNDIRESHAINRPKVRRPSGCPNDREIHLVTSPNQGEWETPMPTYTNYWLAQADPDYVKEESDELISSRRTRKSSLATMQGYRNYLGSYISPDDIRRALQEHFPHSVGDRPGEGTLKPPVDSQFVNNVGFGLATQQVPHNSQERRRKTGMKGYWPMEVI